jgi:hypothetical protein
MNLAGGVERDSELGNALMELEQARVSPWYRVSFDSTAYADSVFYVQLAAIRQFEAMQARKDQDHQEEWMMRQREKTKKVADLPNGEIIERLVQSVQETVKVLGEEIDELEVRQSGMTEQ